MLSLRDPYITSPGRNTSQLWLDLGGVKKKTPLKKIMYVKIINMKAYTYSYIFSVFQLNAVILSKTKSTIPSETVLLGLYVNEFPVIGPNTTFRCLFRAKHLRHCFVICCFIYLTFTFCCDCTVLMFCTICIKICEVTSYLFS